jgi:hypothetical protein
LRDNAGTFNNRAVDFDEVYAHATQGGIDRAYLYDDASGDDTFTAHPTYAVRAGTGFYNFANRFDEVYAQPYQGEYGGDDKAYLYDDPAGADIFSASPTLAKLYGNGFHNEAQFFPKVVAFSGADHGEDEALLYDLEGSNDTFKAWWDAEAQGYKAKLYDEGGTFFNQAESFRWVTAYSDDQTGVDTALLYDLEGSRDIFKAWWDAEAQAHKAKLYDEQGTFFNQANSFRYVTAYSDDKEAEDTAFLYDDPATDDDFRAWPTLAKLYGTDFHNQAESFRWVHGYSQGGDDLARLYDSTGADTFKAWWDAEAQGYQAKLYDEAETFYNMAHSFRYVKAYAEVGSGGTDVAELYDTSGDDYLLARDGDPTGEDWALLRDAADAVYAVWAYGLDEIWADSGSGDDDTADVGEDLDLALHLTGVWENQP